MSFAEEIVARRDHAIFFHAPRFEWVEGQGKDCISFLHRVTTGDVAGVKSGGGTPTMLLDPKSRVQFVSCVFVDGQTARLVVSKGQAAAFASGLSKFAIMDDCSFSAVADRGVLSVFGPAAATVLESVGLTGVQALASAPPMSHQGYSDPQWGNVWIGNVPEKGASALWVAASSSSLAAIVDRLVANGVLALSPETAEILRIQAMEPGIGNEIVPDRFPVEIGLGRAIFHAKGCYVGQETIVRMRDRGNCRRRLVKLHIDSGETPAVGDIVDAADRPAAGHITSACRIPGGNAVALALLSTTLPVGITVKIRHHDLLIDADVVAESKPFE